LTSNKNNDITFPVVFYGYIISAIIFTIWIAEYENIRVAPIIVANVFGFGIIMIIAGWIGESYKLSETNLEQEISLDFEGKTKRAYFWIPFLALFLFVDVLLVALDTMLFGWEPNYPFAGFLGYSMIGTYWTLLPLLALGARRLHDTGRSGWWQLLYFTLIGVLVLIVFWAQESKADKNKDGAIDPSKMTDEIERLSQMFKDGIISEDEFAKAKSKLLS
tara:strand:- start:71 stop:727 length:657 start_codon:yes stop_codon:yes gene_type:complete